MSEQGQAILHLASYPDYFSIDFDKALTNEIIQQLGNYKEYSEIKTETIIEKISRIETYLEWKI